MVEVSSADWLYRIWYHRYVILHHALLAATFASVTLVLETTSLFAALDVFTRMIMSITHATQYKLQQWEIEEKGYRSHFSPKAAGDRPIVLVIPNFPKSGGIFRA